MLATVSIFIITLFINFRISRRDKEWKKELNLLIQELRDNSTNLNKLVISLEKNILLLNKTTISIYGLIKYGFENTLIVSLTKPQIVKHFEED